MSDNQDGSCPDCGAPLEPGFIGYFSGIVWGDNEPVGWRRLAPFVFGSAHFIIGNWTSTPWVRCRAARRCRSCGTLVVPATGDFDRPGPLGARP